MDIKQKTYEKLRLEKAKSVPDAMRDCIPLEGEELIMLRELLNRALEGMDREGKNK